MMRRVLTIIAPMLLCLMARGQSPQFTQFYSNPLFLAPSFAGGIAAHRLVGIFRDQWSVMPGNFTTFGFSYDHNLVNLNSGLGVIFVRDMAGDGRLGSTRAGILYSYDITPTREWHIRPGLGFYYVEHSVNFARLVFGDQLISDPRPPTSIQPPGNPSVRDIDVSSSVIAYSNNIWVGATWNHMLRPDRSFYGDDQARTPFLFSAFGGYRLVVRGIMFRPIEESVTGAFNFRVQGEFRQLDLGIHWFREPFMLGVWYRGVPVGTSFPGSDAFALMAGYRHSRLSLSYSYDITVSGLGFGTGGSHELAVSYTFQIETPRRIRSIPCPTF